MRILYVEDNPANVFLVKRVAQGHDIINYVDGEEALRNIDQDRPDLILMDIQLAGTLNGLEVVRALRAKGIKTPIVAVTAYAMVGDRERCLAAGCDDYIPKPLPISQLLAIITKRSQVLIASQEVTREAEAVHVVLETLEVDAAAPDTPTIEVPAVTATLSISAPTVQTDTAEPQVALAAHASSTPEAEATPELQTAVNAQQDELDVT